MSERVTKNECNSNGDRRATIVSFSRNKDEISIQDDDSEDEITLAPYIQTYLAHSGEQFGCCGVCFPVPFERASKESWWDPKFDSEILEGQYRSSSFAQIRLRFRYSLFYMLILSLIWCSYLILLGILDESQQKAFLLGIIFFLFGIFCLIILMFTQTSYYRRYILPVSVIIALSMCLLSIASVSQSDVLSPPSDFAICIEILMIIYTVIPLPLYLCVILGTIYSVVFEILGTGYALPVRIISHICVHLIALHILIMTNVRMRGTFMKVGQSLLVRRQLEIEKDLKEKMIHSVMPPKVANWLMKENVSNFAEGTRNPSGDINSLFRPFNITSMKDVSILFADIVGFTRMSSKKTASELVSVLNVLFERFDSLAADHGCEKIATLGDCYYCVSGCPTPNPRHAHCCVEMGLGMIKAIAEFDREKDEDVNMRVGVHTGTVLCGIVGRKRFKFDVWSNDVSLANKMESTGKPGRVHISQCTKNFLDEDVYILEPGDVVSGLETYFIVGRKDTFSHMGSTQLSLTSPTQTLPSDQSGNILSFETALTSQPESHLTTANSTQKSNLVNCTISPFENLKDSDVFKDENTSLGGTALSTPSSPTPIPLPRLLSERLNAVKATSLPNVFAREMQVGRSRTSLIANPSPRWRYSRLKIASPKTAEEIGNGKIQQTYSPSPSARLSPPSPTDKGLPVHLDVPKDNLSFCQSLNSRKDSGIRSNSRRSSIQQQLFAMNGLTSNDLMNHRVSGYYTSSQYSLNELDKGKGPKLPPPLGDSFGACFQKLRKQSDLQLIRCVQSNSQTAESFTPPLRRWTLLFKDPEFEEEYRRKAHRTTSAGINRTKTLATARFNTYFDITVSLFVFLSVGVCLFVLFPPSVGWLAVLGVVACLELATVGLCLRSVVRPMAGRRFGRLLDWYPWHCAGGALVSLPLITLLVAGHHADLPPSGYHNAYLLFVSLVHYCNFTQLNCWMKSFLATLGSIVYLVLLTTAILGEPTLLNTLNSTELSLVNMDLQNTTFLNPQLENDSQFRLKPGFLNPQLVNDSELRLKRSLQLNKLDLSKEQSVNSIFDIICNNCISVNRFKRFDIFSSQESNSIDINNNLFKTNSFLIEIYLNVFLLILLVWFLNREFEISYRLSFHGNVVAARDKARVVKMKDQADWLLNNIIPNYVAEHLKSTTKGYSEDVKDAGIIFATIVNFGEMYDESFMEGRECLRVLNELVSDFDELLSQSRFSMVEKIKTIGSTFMAASGLNPYERKPNCNEHLFQLMEFAFALQAAIDNFNTHLLEFNLILRVGYNFGDVTAGVIGTTKLHYDIWGDAVNIASRMDSTGVPNRIQVPSSCIEVLSSRYTFEPRGTVYVKGKDNMEVFLITGRKDLSTNGSKVS